MEFLKEYLGEELYAQVAEKLKDADKVKLANLADGEYVSKAKFEASEKRAKELASQITERDQQLKALEPLSAGNAALTEELKKLQDVNKKAAEDYEARLNRVRFDGALELKLRDAKARNVKAAKALLDLDKIKLDGETLTGFDEQIKTVREQNAFLFEDEGGTGAGGVPQGGGKPLGGGPADPFLSGFDTK